LSAFRLAGLGVLLVLSTRPAFALKPAQHTVEWYRTHQHEREAVLQTCQNDHSADNEAECRNALSGAHAALADSLMPARAKEPEADPAYYGHDAGMIAMMLSVCANGGVPESWYSAAYSAARTASANLRR
jgi:hypothetical protein